MLDAHATNGGLTVPIPEPRNADSRTLRMLTAKIYRAQMKQQHDLDDQTLPSVGVLAGMVDLQPVLQAMVEHAMPQSDVMISAAIDETASLRLARQLDDTDSGGTGQAAEHKWCLEEEKKNVKVQKLLKSLHASSSNAVEDDEDA